MMSNKLIFSISKNHYNNYRKVTIDDDWTQLAKHLANDCVCPITILKDEERLDKDDKPYTSKNHRAGRNIVERGNIAIIDFEGKQAKYDELIKSMKVKDIWFVSIPSQSNLSDKKNRRAHIAYKLSTPYTINKDAFKEQAKAFFEYIGYEWDTPDSGIDTTATFNAVGYFSPTFQLKYDAKTKKIPQPYKDVDQVQKDMDINVKKPAKAYEPIKPESIEENDGAVVAEAKAVGDTEEKNFKSNMIQVYKKGYKVKPTMSVPVASGGWTTMEKIVNELKEMGGEEANPIISGFGCPECHKDHGSDPTSTRYAFAGIDDIGVPFVMCNGASHQAIYRVAETDVTVWRTVLAKGDSKYIILNDGKIHFTDESVESVIMSAGTCADELNMTYGMGVSDEDGMYSRGMTIQAHITETPSLALWYHPYLHAGLHVDRTIYNLVSETKYNPEPEEPNDIVKIALQGFENDEVWKDIPIGLIYLSYYMFHHKKIMAMMFLVNPQRGIGKSTWAIDIPGYIMSNLWGVMDTQAIENAWDDAKLGKRAVCLEDIENLSKEGKKKLVAILKSDATAGESKLLNIKTKGQVKSFGHNTLGTTNHRNQIPLDGLFDRRIHVIDFKAVDDKKLIGAFDVDKKGGEKNIRNACNYLYSIYLKCEENMEDELYGYLYSKTPVSVAKQESMEENLLVGHQIGLAFKNTKDEDKLYDILSSLVNIDEEHYLKGTMGKIRFGKKWKNKPRFSVHCSTLLEIYNFTTQENKRMSPKAISYTLGLDYNDVKQIKIDGKNSSGYHFG